MASAAEIAEWMATEFNKTGKLVQRVAAQGIGKTFGQEFLYKNKNGNPAIVAPILKAFRIAAPDAVWNRWDQTWHRRKPGQTGRSGG